MYSPRIDDKHIPVLYRRAKREKKPMTTVVNEILEDNLYVIAHCQSCNSEIEVEDGAETAYCEFCDCEVYLKETV